MSLFQFLFGFQGRARRLHLWLFVIVLSIFYGGLFWQFGHLHVDHNEVVRMRSHWRSDSFTVVTHNPLVLLFGLVAAWMKLAVFVKRWHDRDKSGWWVLINIIPILGWAWTIIECGFLPGTDGPNKYGPSPKS